MSNLLTAIFLAAAIFAGGYLMGGSDEAADHARTEAALRLNLQIVNDNLKKSNALLRGRTNANVNTIKGTKDTTGCAHTDVPPDIFSGVY